MTELAPDERPTDKTAPALEPGPTSSGRCTASAGPSWPVRGKAARIPARSWRRGSRTNARRRSW